MWCTLQLSSVKPSVILRLLLLYISHYNSEFKKFRNHKIKQNYSIKTHSHQYWCLSLNEMSKWLFHYCASAWALSNSDWVWLQKITNVHYGITLHHREKKNRNLISAKRFSQQKAIEGSCTNGIVSIRSTLFQQWNCNNSNWILERLNSALLLFSDSFCCYRWVFEINFTVNYEDAFVQKKAMRINGLWILRVAFLSSSSPFIIIYLIFVPSIFG